MTTTLDTIHTTLERLGYTGEDFGADRTTQTLYAAYRKAGESVSVGWSNGSTVYDVSATTDAAIRALCDELTSKGLSCTPAGRRMDVHGQEHIDAVVMKLLQS